MNLTKNKSNIIFLFTLIFLFPVYILGYENNEPLAKYKNGKIAEIIFADENPIIDGISDDEIWESAIPISDFVQTDPINMGTPTQKTEVSLLYTHQNIFILAKLFDNQPNKISTTLALKDDWYEGFDDKADYFRIEFDSRHDHQTAFSFSVNASGVQLDEFVFDDSGYDGDWNAVWTSETIIDSNGWTIEIQIPFSVFRFTKKDEMVWGLNIARYIHRNNEYISWVGYPHGIGGVASKYGHLTGLKKFMIQRKLQFKPYAILGQSTFNNTIVKMNDYHGNQDEFQSMIQKNNIGLDIKYIFNSDVSIETTINPDFGQIEADPTEINLTAYETYYTEKRQFFIENATIFETPINIFYSRRIGENLDSILINGTMKSINSSYNDSISQETKITSAYKLVGKSQTGFTYGILRAITHNELTSFDIQRNINKYTNLRIIQDIFDGNSYLGMIISNMTNSFQTSSAYSIDGVFSLFENQIYSDFQGVISNVDENSGIGFTSSINYESTHPWEFWFLNSYYDKSFNIDRTGYLWRNNLEEYSIGVGYSYREPIWNFRKLYFSLEFEYANNLDKIPLEKKISISANQLWQNYWNTGILFDYSPQHYDDLLTYDYEDGKIGPIMMIPKSNGLKLFLQTDQRGLFSGRIEWGWGNNNWGDVGTNIFTGIKWSPNENINLNLDYYNGNSSEKFHWVEITEEKIIEYNQQESKRSHFIFSQSKNNISVMTGRFNLSFNREMSLQVYSEYFMSHTKHSTFLELIPDSSEFPISNTEYITEVYVDPTQPSFNPNIVTDFEIGKYLASPNIEPSLYPKYSSYSTNIVFRWDYQPGSSLYIVYTNYKGINGELLLNPFEVFTYKLRNKKWVETYLDHSIFIKIDYWFDI
jgi:hypothetical protein